MKRIIISRTDSIGDVILTLPLCQWLKQHIEGCQIIFLGKVYTKDIILSYDLVDEFVDWDKIENSPTANQLDEFRTLNADVIIHVFPNSKIASLAKKVKIPMRIGTSHRSYHLLTCNQRPNFTRKRSDLHEAQLNFELLRPLGLKEIPTLKELNKSTAHFLPNKEKLVQNIEEFIQNHPDFVVLHPKSQGSALEWPIEKYMELAKELATKNKAVVFTGTAIEGAQFRGHIPTHELIIDSTGLLTLGQLITLISRATAIVACSTGPLHIGGILGIKAIGLYSPKRPIHPGRWKPLGNDSKAIVFNENCSNCKSNKQCECITNIDVEKVSEMI